MRWYVIKYYNGKYVNYMSSENRCHADFKDNPLHTMNGGFDNRKDAEIVASKLYTYAKCSCKCINCSACREDVIGISNKVEACNGFSVELYEMSGADELGYIVWFLVFLALGSFITYCCFDSEHYLAGTILTMLGLVVHVLWFWFLHDTFTTDITDGEDNATNN
jgi:hypothetical protein